jgi:putative spermidine/putrescine transport system permease protein
VGGVAVLEQSPPTGPAASIRRGALRGPWLGIVPFAIYVLVFLGVPLYEVIHGAFTGQKGGLTWFDFSQTFSQPQYRSAFFSSLRIAAETAAIGGFFGVWLAAAVVTSSPRNPLRRIVGSGSAVLAYFAGVPLAFAFIATLGRFGELTIILEHIGINLNYSGFTISSLTGVELAYVYFQIPLMVLLVTPALEGLRAEWREAATGLGASSFGYVRHIAGPVLAPAILGGVLLLFGNAFAAYATAYALVGDTVQLVPGQIQQLMSGNVLVNENNIGLALGVEMIVVIAFIMVGYALLQRRAGKWLQ